MSSGEGYYKRLTAETARRTWCADVGCQPVTMLDVYRYGAGWNLVADVVYLDNGFTAAYRRQGKFSRRGIVYPYILHIVMGAGEAGRFQIASSQDMSV